MTDMQPRPCSRPHGGSPLIPAFRVREMGGRRARHPWKYAGKPDLLAAKNERDNK
jgi:hypothetical protein